MIGSVEGILRFQVLMRNSLTRVFIK